MCAALPSFPLRGRRPALSTSADTPLLTEKSRQPRLQTETSATKAPTSGSFLTVLGSNLPPPIPAITLSQPTTHHAKDIPLLLFQSYTRSYTHGHLRCHPHWPHTCQTHNQHWQCPGLQEAFTVLTRSPEQGLGQVQ